jgi:hypothetical protein
MFVPVKKHQRAFEICCWRPHPRGAAYRCGWPTLLDLNGDTVRSKLLTVLTLLIWFMILFSAMWQFGMMFIEDELAFEFGMAESTLGGAVAYVLFGIAEPFVALSVVAMGNSVSQHPIVGVVAVAALWFLLSGGATSGLLAATVSNTLLAFMYPTCAGYGDEFPFMSVFYGHQSRCVDRDQHLHFFMGWCLLLSAVVASVIQIVNAMSWCCCRRPLRTAEVWALCFTRDLYRCSGMHHKPMSAPIHDRVDIDDNDAGDDDADFFELRDDPDALNCDDPNAVSRRLHFERMHGGETQTLLVRVGRCLRAIRATPATLFHVGTSAGHRFLNHFRSLVEWNDPRIRYPLRLTTTIAIAAMMTVCLIWMLFNQLLRLCDWLESVRSEIASFQGRIVFLQCSSDDNCVDEAMVTLRTSLLVFGSLHAFIVAIALAYGWLAMLKSYRLLIFKMRRGIFPHRDPGLMRVTFFTGISTILQCSTIFVAAAMVLVLGTLFTLAYSVVPTTAKNAATHFAASYIGIYGSRWLLSFCMLQSHRSVISNYVCWSLLEVLNVVLGVTVGPYSAIVRFVFQSVAGCAGFSRVDVSVMPSGFEHADRPFMSFVAVVLMDHRVNNPIMRAFILMATDRHLPHDQQQPSQAILSAQKRARNRWWLWVILIRNPGIRKFRKHCL